MAFSPVFARFLAAALGDEHVTERAEKLDVSDAGHGFDRFGLHPDFIALSDAITSPLYEKYFRVASYGAEHIPSTGPAILAANHSGVLPVDGMMLYADVLRNTHPPRVVRPVADYFVSSLPLVSTLFARCGVVGGSRGNARALLGDGELLMIFPEGTPGISKNFSRRYQLQTWRQGHAELAIRHRAPVIPVAVIGAEEQMPQLGKIPLPKGGLPFIPIPAVPVPLPVQYHIHYGEPLRFDQDYAPEDADIPERVEEAAARVADSVAALIEQGLSRRDGVF